MRQIAEDVMRTAHGGEHRGETPVSSRARRRIRCWSVLALGAFGAGVLGGCNADSFIDPSVTGYWEKTPTTMPILDRIASIEDKAPEYVETTPPAREDLIAQAQAYRMGAGDEIQITIPDIEQRGFMSQYPRSIDQRGFITIPRVGQVFVLGKTDLEAEAAIAKSIADAQILMQPTVSVVITAPRQQLYSILGGVRNPGVFIVGKPDYRLLDGIAAAGGIDESIEKIYVIRQIPLSEGVTGRAPAPPEKPDTRPAPSPPVNPKELKDVIDDLTKPTKPKEPGSPGLSVVGGGVPDVNDGTGVRAAYTGLQPDQPKPATPPKDKPPIELIDSNAPPAAKPEQPAAAPKPNEPPATTLPGPARSRSHWVFINGQWVRGLAAAAKAGTAAPNPLEGHAPAKDLITQRVIEVPVKPLLAGQADVNIVIRPGDVVRVPVPETGIVYIGGQVAHPGTFALPTNGTLTLTRAMDAAGGLGQLAIPERVDITRIVGPNRQATIMLNLRAIEENTQPDLILKPDDRITVGTNFWAFPLAVLRTGLRMTYGYGFIVDRNFGNDVFGVPPGSINGQ